jgi:succinoglycan biosynthesis protein ExoM
MKKHKVVVGVATYRRPKSLKVLLSALQNQTITELFEVMILVVDNDCSGEVSNLISEFSSARIRVCMAVEPRKGISYARNKVVEVFLDTDANYLIFIDDDEWPLRNDWVMALLKVQIESGADMVTGYVETIPENEKLSWMINSRHHFTQDQSIVNKFYTGNLLISRKVLEIIKPAFNLEFNETGSEDLHFSVKCRKHGFKALYTDKAPVQQLFFESRSNLKWFFMRGYRLGLGSTKICLLEGDSFIYSVFKSLFYSFLRGCRAFYTLFLSIIFIDKGLFMLAVKRLGSSIGSLMGIFGVNYYEYKTIHGR